jgi:hypothetical protein
MGRAITNPAKYTPATREFTNHSLRQSITGAQNRFHEALDEMEAEIHLAQAVLRRDLAVLRQEKAEKAEAARKQAIEEASKKKAAAEAEAAKAAAEKARAEAEEAARKKREEEEEERRRKQDIEMADAPPKPPPVDTSGANDKNGSLESANKTPNTANTFDLDSMFEDMGDGGDNSATGGDMDFTFDMGDHTQQNDDLLSELEQSNNANDSNPPATTSAPAPTSTTSTNANSNATTTAAATASVPATTNTDTFDFGSFDMDDGGDSYMGGGGSTFDEMFNYDDFETGGGTGDNDLDEMFKDLN